MTTENAPVEVDRVGEIPIYFDGKSKFYAHIGATDAYERGRLISRTTLAALKRELNKQAKPIRCFVLRRTFVNVDRDGNRRSRSVWVDGKYTLDETVNIGRLEPEEMMLSDYDERSHRYRDERGRLIWINDSGPYVWDDAAVEALRAIAREEFEAEVAIAWKRHDAMKDLKQPRKEHFVRAANTVSEEVPAT